MPDQPGVAGRVLTALADANVNVDMIIQNEPDDRADMSFTVPRDDVRQCARRARAAQGGVRHGRSPSTSGWGRSRWSARE